MDETKHHTKKKSGNALSSVMAEDSQFHEENLCFSQIIILVPFSISHQRCKSLIIPLEPVALYHLFKEEFQKVINIFVYNSNILL